MTTETITVKTKYYNVNDFRNNYGNNKVTDKHQQVQVQMLLFVDRDHKDY